MKHLATCINEALDASKKKKWEKELDDLLNQDQFKDTIDPDKEIIVLLRKADEKEIHLHKSTNKEELLKIWIDSKDDPKGHGRYCSFQKDMDSAKKVCNNFKDCKIIDHTKD